MSKYRNSRINAEIMRELCEILRTVKDPRVTTAFVSITSVDCTPDLKFAKVYFSVMGERRAGDAQKGLENAAGYFRTRLADALNLRVTPELKFVRDTSMEHGAHISKLLKDIESELADADGRDGSETPDVGADAGEARDGAEDHTHAAE